MKWIIAALLILGLSYVIGSDLLAYAMYSLLTLICADGFPENWAEQLSATRECFNRLQKSMITSAWNLRYPIREDSRLDTIEDVLSKKALQHTPPVWNYKRVALNHPYSEAVNQRFSITKCNRRGFYQLDRPYLKQVTCSVPSTVSSKNRTQYLRHPSRPDRWPRPISRRPIARLNEPSSVRRQHGLPV